MKGFSMSESVKTARLAAAKDSIEIEVDGLPVEVSKSEYEADPSAVEQQVRDARASLRLPEDTEQASDYDAYVEQFGQDGDPNDEVE